MRKLISAFFLFLISGSYIAFQTIFDIPDTPLLMSLQHGVWQQTHQCYKSHGPRILDRDGELNLLVWNIYKQNRSGWQRALEGLSKDAQLVLLQEGSLKAPFTGWLTQSGWKSSHVQAFKAFNVSAGVINLSGSEPIKACAYTQLEPWLRLPKSALYALYPLSNGQTLAVINIHAVNFTFGVEEYREQLKALKEAVLAHEGPIVIAGDFNSWSGYRMTALLDELKQLGVQKVDFNPDNRTVVMTGYRLDHLFFRGLELIDAKAPVTDASDHNPLQVSFNILE